MKKIIPILLTLFFCNKQIAQETLTQKQWFENGQKYLKKDKLEIAISQFHVAESYGLKDKDLDIKKSARKKIDSLLPIAQKKIIKQWKGNWKLKELHDEGLPLIKFSEYIRIDDDKIIFYKKDSKGKQIILRSEPIRFFPYDSVKSSLNLREIVFENSEIWKFTTVKKKSQKRLYVTCERDSSGESYETLDHRGFVMDRKERRRSKKIEIYTYYVKSK